MKILRCAPHQCQRMVSGELKVAHDLDGHEVTVVETGSRGVEPAIEGDGPVGQRRAQRVDVGVLGDEPAPLQFVQDVRHCPVAFRESSCVLHALSRRVALGAGGYLRRG